MNTDTLHAVDTLYLQMFQQNLIAELRRASIMLRHHLKQSEPLSIAQELPSSFRSNYAEISERLLPLVDALGGMESDLASGSLSWQMQPDEGRHIEAEEPGENDKTAEIIAWLDTTELKILDVLGNVGERLVTLPRSIISWSDCGFFNAHVELKRLSERQCYHLDAQIDICSQPDFCADYFARKNYDRSQTGRWPHYLLDDLIPISLLPLIEELWIEMDVHGDGHVPRWTRERINGCDISR